jgi:group I intron endonuclease
MKKSGVYKITNEANGKFYVGSSKDIEQRFTEHKMMLKNNKHVNIILQRSWNKYTEKSFSFTILEECPPENCALREQHYLDTLQPFKSIGYNIGKTALGGDNFSNNPNKEQIREKMKEWNGGENNGMFGKHHTDTAISKQKQRAVGRYTLEWFIEKYGEDDGKVKYQERREILSNRDINYVYDNGLKGKKVVVESGRGKKVSEGRKILKKNKDEFEKDIKDSILTNIQVSEKYGVSTTTVKYHRKKIRDI